MGDLISGFLAAFVLALLSGAQAQDQKIYTVQNWPADMEKIPCDAWRKNPDGSWTEVAIFIVGSARITGNTFRGNREAAALDRRCGQK